MANDGIVDCAMAMEANGYTIDTLRRHGGETLEIVDNEQQNKKSYDTKLSVPETKKLEHLKLRRCGAVSRNPRCNKGKI
jgi:hypothetical protein